MVITPDMWGSRQDFQRLGVDGAGLAATTDEQLRMRFGMPPQDQAVFFRERETLDRIVRTGDWGLETEDWRLETEDWRLETGDWRLRALRAD